MLIIIEQPKLIIIKLIFYNWNKLWNIKVLERELENFKKLKELWF